MPDISTEYMGLKLKSPVIMASGPLTSHLDDLKRAEDAGAGAVVLKSIFEEQIEKDAGLDAAENEEYLAHSDSQEYFEAMARAHYIDRYMTLLEGAKKSLGIPVIASINCKSISTWLEYSQNFLSCGADAIELNYFPIASNADVSGDAVDKALFDFAKRARGKIEGKLALKIGSFYSSLSNVIKKIDDVGFDGLVLFNRPFRPDIDLKSLEIRGCKPLSSPDEYGMSLRWTALMSAEVKLDIAANTGIHSADTLIKMLLAGAKAAEVCSAVIKNGFSVIGEMNKGLSAFMEEKGYESTRDFIALLAEDNYERGDAWERVQFLKTIGNDNER